MSIVEASSKYQLQRFSSRAGVWLNEADVKNIKTLYPIMQRLCKSWGPELYRIVEISSGEIIEEGFLD